MQQYKVSGVLEYLLRCPKAPGVAVLCDPPAACDGHPYQIEISVYVEAPGEDPDRAAWAALKRLAGPYPWPQWWGAPAIQPVEPEEHAAPPASAPLPGFEATLRRGSVAAYRVAPLTGAADD